MPEPAKANVPSILIIKEPKQEIERQQLVSTKNVIDKNLFDPERGAGKIKEAEAALAAAQRISGMVLVGTAILEDSRYVILQEPSESRPSAPGSQKNSPSYLRLKLGDAVEDFRLSEIEDKRVVFTKGSTKVEILLDFFSRSGGLTIKAGPVRPGIGQPAPRRDRLPPPPLSR